MQIGQSTPIQATLIRPFLTIYGPGMVPGYVFDTLYQMNRQRGGLMQPCLVDSLPTDRYYVLRIGSQIVGWAFTGDNVASYGHRQRDLEVIAAGEYYPLKRSAMFFIDPPFRGRGYARFLADKVHAREGKLAMSGLAAEYFPEYLNNY